MAARSPVRRLAYALLPTNGNLSRDERDAVNALALHLLSRVEQDAFEPLDPDGRTFLTVRYMQCRLREVGARCSGEKAAAAAIRWLCTSRLLEDTDEVKKPRRRQNRMAAREKFAPATQETDRHCSSSGADRDRGSGRARARRVPCRRRRGDGAGASHRCAREVQEVRRQVTAR